jgi:hypothetical protein
MVETYGNWHGDSGSKVCCVKRREPSVDDGRSLVLFDSACGAEAKKEKEVRACILFLREIARLL